MGTKETCARRPVTRGKKFILWSHKAGTSEKYVMETQSGEESV